MNPIFSSQEINKNENNYLDSLKHNYSLLNKKIKHFQENIFIYQPYFLPEHQIYIPIPVYKQTEKKYGRRKKGEIILKKPNHSKYSFDNIMRKIKVYIFKYLIKFCNIYISNEKKLVNLNYKKYISNLKIDLNIGMLNTSLKDLLSYETTKKYKKYRYDTKNYNKNIIDSILIKEANNKNIMKLLNMKFIDWIDIYLLKKKAEDEIQFDGLSSILSDLISNYPDEEDIAYIKKFIINLYNYKNWFQRKIGRIGKKPKSN
jgi:hypothetical protein